MSLILDEHRELLADPARIDALGAAIAAAVRPGDVVVDVASGTGILGLMACRAGAARVYAIEEGGIIQLARALAHANGYADRIHFVSAHSSWAALPERADIVVCDQMGHFGFEAGLIGTIADVRRRMLKPEGRVLPERVDLFVALTTGGDVGGRLDFWSTRPGGFDFSPARETAVNTGYPVRLESADLLSAGVRGCGIDLTSGDEVGFGFTAALTAERDGTLRGIAGWFDAHLAGGVRMTNSPDAQRRIARRNVVFPIDHAVAVRAGDAVAVTMRIRPGEHLVRWIVDVRNGEQRFDHATLRGMLMPEERLRRTHPASVPTLTERGRARHTVLQLCDGRPLSDVERGVFAHHPALFDSFGAAQTFVAEVVTRYCE